MEPALTEYEQALRLAPGNPKYRTSIALVYLQIDAPVRAIEIMQSVVAEYPDAPVYKYYLARSRRQRIRIARPGRTPVHGHPDGGCLRLRDRLRGPAAVVHRAGRSDSRPRLEGSRGGEQVYRMRQMITLAQTVRWNTDRIAFCVTVLILFGVFPFLSGLKRQRRGGLVRPARRRDDRGAVRQLQKAAGMKTEPTQHQRERPDDPAGGMR